MHLSIDSMPIWYDPIAETANSNITLFQAVLDQPSVAAELEGELLGEISQKSSTQFLNFDGLNRKLITKIWDN